MICWPIWLPHQHRTNLQSTNPIERLNKEVKRRNCVVSFFLNEASMLRLMRAVVFWKNVDWQRSGRDMMVEAFAEVS
jgi:transposase-like protein